ncbi:MAG: hypothetical protein KDD02_05665 [Phaeodactylibacter sp.]|nr:hypothetical protein [Phaeodactylibacter sp.]MCB9299933.1 hypothetical protein [Lewinellaceae bacterium]
MKNVNKLTGLTEQQERAAQYFADGATMEGCAEELGVPLTALYEWQEKPTFQAYFNRLSWNLKQNIAVGVMGLYKDALDAIRASLQSENESVKLKTAMYVIERIDNLSIGTTNAKEMIREQCKSTMFSEVSYERFDQEKYEQLCRENNLEP